MAEKYPSKRKTKDQNFKETTTSRFTSKERKQAGPSSNDSVYNSSTEVSSTEVSLRDQSGATPSVFNSSDFDMCCDPCSTDGDHNFAVGYCSECCEYYCEACYRAHARSKATKDHTLLDQSIIASMNMQPTTGMDKSKFLKYKRDINVKHLNDQSSCGINGIVAISDREIVIIDHFNDSIKVIDVIDDVISSYMKFDSEPCRVTAIPNNEVAVTFHYERRIMILTTTGGLAVKRVLKVDGCCLAVEYLNDKLYVSYVGWIKFQILSLSGRVKRTIKPDKHFHEHCTWPCFMAIHPDESRLYVSDSSNDALLCMDMNGTLLSLYKGKHICAPMDITFTPFGSLYLCRTAYDAVYKVAEDLSEAIVVLDKQDGVYRPGTMCLSPGRRSLYISCVKPKYHNFIKEFK